MGVEGEGHTHQEPSRQSGGEEYPNWADDARQEVIGKRNA
jgi:hypothetical protein